MDHLFEPAVSQISDLVPIKPGLVVFKWSCHRNIHSVYIYRVSLVSLVIVSYINPSGLNKMSDSAV